jgi:hypothetical protein
MKLQRKAKIRIYGSGKKNRSKLKGKHKHVNTKEKKSEIIIVMTSIYGVKVKIMRMTEKGRVYIMYGNRNRTQQVRVNRYRVYETRNTGVYTNTANTGVQKQQYRWTPNPGCIVGEKEKSNVKISDRSANVNSGKCVKCMYIVVIRCCKKPTLVYKMWSLTQKKKVIVTNAEKWRKVKIRTTRKSTTKYRASICKNVVMITEECIGSRSRYKLTNVNPIPVSPKMDNQRKGELRKEDDVEMADPALTGLNSVFTTIVSGILLALNMCSSLLVKVLVILLNKVRLSCRAVISLDCFLSCCTSIVINEYACKTRLHIARLHSALDSIVSNEYACKTRLHKARSHSAIYRIVPAKIRIYVIVELTFIIWCGRYGE